MITNLSSLQFKQPRHTPIDWKILCTGTQQFRKHWFVLNASPISHNNPRFFKRYMFTLNVAKC